MKQPAEVLLRAPLLDQEKFGKMLEDYYRQRGWNTHDRHPYQRDTGKAWTAQGR